MILNKNYTKETQPIKHWVFPKFLPYQATTNLKSELEELFDFRKKESQYECFNYKNLQPLWAKDNLVKSNKLDYLYETDNPKL